MIRFSKDLGGDGEGRETVKRGKKKQRRSKERDELSAGPGESDIYKKKRSEANSL